MTNHNSLQDCFKKKSFELVDSWAKILHFRTHHIYNSTTELTLMYALLNYLSRNQKNNNSILDCCNMNLKKSFQPCTQNFLSPCFDRRQRSGNLKLTTKKNPYFLSYCLKSGQIKNIKKQFNSTFILSLNSLIVDICGQHQSIFVQTLLSCHQVFKLNSKTSLHNAGAKQNKLLYQVS